MNIDIRQSIKNNFKENSINEIKESIETSIKDAEEITLPGLGVFFEILWNNSSDDIKNTVLKTLKNNI